MNKSAPSLPVWLHEIIQTIYNEMPMSVAELQLSPKNSPKFFSAEIVPRSKRAARILISAEEGDWEATIGFGKSSQIDARYYDEPDAASRFKKRVLDICKAITESHWEERVVMRGSRIVKCIAMLPEPVGPAQITYWRPFSLSSLLKKAETSIQWEPYSPVKNTE